MIFPWLRVAAGARTRHRVFDQGFGLAHRQFFGGDLIGGGRIKIGTVASSGSVFGRRQHNAVMERFFLNLKMERVWQKDYANHLEASNDIADYIVGFYNALRLHSKLGNMSPNAFERESTSEKSIELSEIT